MMLGVKILAGVLAAGTVVASPASATHFCYGMPVYPVETPAVTLYVHDRCASNSDPLCPEGGGRWIFMENGLAEGLQVGGEAIVEPMNDLGSDDPCPRDPNADDVVF